MFQINTSTKKFTEAASLTLGQLPVIDAKIDFRLNDGTNPVIAENKTFSMTIGSVQGTLYKTDGDTVSFRYLKFDDNNVADSLVIVMTMDGVEILNDVVSLTYQGCGGGGASITVDTELSGTSSNPVANSTITQALNNKADNDYLCFTAEQANSTIRLDKIGTPPTINLEYSTDRKTWTEYTWDGTTGATITLTNIGDSIWWRGDNATLSTSYDKYYYFSMVGEFSATGNIMSLLDKQLKKKTVPSYCFYSIFQNCTSLGKAPELPATILADNCYSQMFAGCTLLIKAPELPATMLAERCYDTMFSGCTRLTKAPELPATMLAERCYFNMFYGCTSLTTAPELTATTLASQCYGLMFRGCTNISKIKVHFTEWRTDITAIGGWLLQGSPTGVLECPSALDCSTRDVSHVPAGWTIVRTDAPKSITSPTTASSEATYQVSPNTPSVPVVTVASALTLNAGMVDNGSVAYSEIVLDVATGATITAGANLTLVDTPTAGKRNICVCRWSGGVCKLYVTIVEDLPQA